MRNFCESFTNWRETFVLIHEKYNFIIRKWAFRNKQYQYLKQIANLFCFHAKHWTIIHLQTFFFILLTRVVILQEKFHFTENENVLINIDKQITCISCCTEIFHSLEWQTMLLALPIPFMPVKQYTVSRTWIQYVYILRRAVGFSSLCYQFLQFSFLFLL